jgi:hypothetical protein
LYFAPALRSWEACVHQRMLPLTARKEARGPLDRARGQVQASEASAILASQ